MTFLDSNWHTKVPLPRAPEPGLRIGDLTLMAWKSVELASVHKIQEIKRRVEQTSKFISQSLWHFSWLAFVGFHFLKDLALIQLILYRYLCRDMSFRQLRRWWSTNFQVGTCLSLQTPVAVLSYQIRVSASLLWFWSRYHFIPVLSDSNHSPNVIIALVTCIHLLHRTDDCDGLTYPNEKFYHGWFCDTPTVTPPAFLFI